MTIVFNSNTGTTQKYAEALAEKLSCDCVPLSKADNIEGDVIFMSWIMMGEIQALADARSKFSLKAIAAVGCMDLSEEGQAKVKEKNKIEETFFMLPGTFYINRLSGMYKMMLKMAINMMKGKIKNSDNPNDAKALKMLEDGVDFYDESKLDVIVEAMNG